MTSDSQKIGKVGEKIASLYLLSLGYEIQNKNVFSRQGEIDILCFDTKNNEYVCVEVKCKSNTIYGNSVEAISEKKKLRILQAVEKYFSEKETVYYRIDCICIDKEKSRWKLKHYKNIEIEKRKEYKNTDFIYL